MKHMEMRSTFTTDTQVCTFNTGTLSKERMTVITQLENYVGSTSVELLMGLPHSLL